MQKIVEKFIEDEKLLKKNSKVILGVSGGADSIALLNVLHNAGYETIVAHCNFHLRHEESMRDEAFVKSFCEERQLEYRSVHFDTIRYAAQHSLSIEMAARALRYSWFEELRQEFKAEAIAVGHHKDDSIETMLMNLVRGTGIKGLTGIKPKVGYIIRPFLCVNRTDIEEYTIQSGLSYVDDSSNSESIYTRNIIRLDVMPYLERINPSARQSIFKTIQHLRQVEHIYAKYIEQAKSEVLVDNTINIEKLKKDIEPQALLFEIVSEYGFNSSDTEDMMQALDGQSGKTFYFKSHRIVKDRDYLIIDSEDVKKKHLA